MKIKEVATVAKAISCPKEDLSTEIVYELKKGHHLDLFGDRREFVEIFEGKSVLLSELVVSLEADYASLYKTLKGRHYANFQMKWLEHVAEYGYALATMDAQVVDQDDVYLYSSESFGKWASICLEFTSHSTEDLGVDSNYIMLHQIAKQVYNSKQMQVLESKHCQISASVNPPLPAQSSDDSLCLLCSQTQCHIFSFRCGQRNHRLFFAQPAHCPTSK